MKKILLRAVIASFSVALLFPSCLGNSDSYYESAGGSLIYIGSASESSGYQQYGVAQELRFMFTSDYIKSLTSGRIYDMAFKVNLEGSGVILADYTTPIGDGTPLSRGYSSSYVPAGGTVNLPGTAINPTGLGVSYFMALEEDANDTWAFSFTCNGFEEDFIKDDSGNYVNLDFYAYIEEDKQNLPIDGGSKPLDHNQAIVNLYMVRKPSAPALDPAKKKAQPKKYFTINMSQLRTYFEGEVKHEEGVYYTPVAIQFRYMGEDSKGTIKEESLGGLDFNQNIPYFMAIENPNKPK